MRGFDWRPPLVTPKDVVTELLREVIPLFMRVLLKMSKPESWTKGAWARDGNGAPVRITDPRARSWCLLAMIVWAEAELHGPPELREPPLPLFRPRRLAVAVALLSTSTLLMYEHHFGPDFAPLFRRGLRGAEPVPLEPSDRPLVDPTLAAAMVNDYDGVELEHVLATLAASAMELKLELGEREGKP